MDRLKALNHKAKTGSSLLEEFHKLSAEIKTCLEELDELRQEINAVQTYTERLRELSSGEAVLWQKRFQTMTLHISDTSAAFWKLESEEMNLATSRCLWRETELSKDVARKERELEELRKRKAAVEYRLNFGGPDVGGGGGIGVGGGGMENGHKTYEESELLSAHHKLH